MPTPYFLCRLFVCFFLCGQMLWAQQTPPSPSVPLDQTPGTILFFGTSLTAGYGLLPEQAFSALIQTQIDSLGWPYRVINAGVSGETSAAGRRRIEWVLRQTIDVFVLELGANDGLRGISLTSTMENLQALLDKLKEKSPHTTLIIAGMEIPPNLGAEYTTQFRSIFPTLAQKNNATLIPFLLKGVAGVPTLNLVDGIHPTPQGHVLIASTIWQYLQPILKNKLLATP